MRRTGKIAIPAWEDIHDRDNTIKKLCDGIEDLTAITFEREITPEDRQKLYELMVKARYAL